MTKWQIKIKPSAKNDLKKLMQSNLRNRFKEIVETIEQNPYNPIQSFEKLEPSGKNYYSRRLNSQHRIIYKINKQNKLYSHFILLVTL